MERHGDGGAVGDLQVGGADLDPLFRQGGDLFFQMFRVDDHAAAHDADDLRAQDARRDQVEDEFAAFILDRVAGVVAALIARDDVIILAEQVHHAALALVAPVDTGDRSKHTSDSFCKILRHFSLFRFSRDPPPFCIIPYPAGDFHTCFAPDFDFIRRRAALPS